MHLKESVLFSDFRPQWKDGASFQPGHHLVHPNTPVLSLDKMLCLVALSEEFVFVVSSF